MSSSIRDGRFSHSVEFTVDPLHVEDLVTTLITRIERFTCFCPGFIKADVQVSDEGDRALMHILWSSRAHGEQALKSAQRLDSDLFQLARQHHAKALLFSTYNVVAEVYA